MLEDLKEELETNAIGYVTIHSVLFNLNPDQKVLIEVNFPEYKDVYRGTAEKAFTSTKVKKMFDYPIDLMYFYFNEDNPRDKDNGAFVIQSTSSYGTLKELQAYHENAVKELAEYNENN